MHIPDGFLSPQTYLPAYVVAGLAWAWAVRDVQQRLDEETVPRLAVLTALAYVLGLIMLPLPGGTSAHVLGVPLLALHFGVRLAFIAYSGVLVLQSFLLGVGGVTALGVNALILGLIGASVAVGSQRLLVVLGEQVAVLISTFLAIQVSALLIAVVLGVQPLISHRPDGSPLFFPLGLSVTLPAIVLPHVLIGAGEAVLTLMVWRYGRRKGWGRRWQA